MTDLRYKGLSTKPKAEIAETLVPLITANKKLIFINQHPFDATPKDAFIVFDNDASILKPKNYIHLKDLYPLKTKFFLFYSFVFFDQENIRRITRKFFCGRAWSETASVLQGVSQDAQAKECHRRVSLL